MVENTRGYSNSSKTRQIGSLRVTANYYTWCILWLVHLTQHVVTSNSAAFMHTHTYEKKTQQIMQLEIIQNYDRKNILIVFQLQEYYF